MAAAPQLISEYYSCTYTDAGRGPRCRAKPGGVKSNFAASALPSSLSTIADEAITRNEAACDTLNCEPLYLSLLPQPVTRLMHTEDAPLWPASDTEPAMRNINLRPRGV